LTKVIEFEERRFYPIFDNEEPYVSVTTVLGCLAKPALIAWAAKVTAVWLRAKFEEIKTGALDIQKMNIEEMIKQAKAYHRELKEKAGTIGDRVHKRIHSMFNAKRLGDDEEYQRMLEVCEDSQIAKPWEGVTRWIIEDNIIPIRIEEVVFSQKGKWAGKLDFFGLVEGIPTIIDFKTSGGFYDEYKMQLAAYYFGYLLTFGHTSGDNPQRGMVIRFDKESGELSRYPMTHQELLWEYQRFLPLVKYYRQTEEVKKRRII
jgi:hypothetical protein